MEYHGICKAVIPNCFVNDIGFGFLPVFPTLNKVLPFNVVGENFVEV